MSECVCVCVSHAYEVGLGEDRHEPQKKKFANVGSPLAAWSTEGSSKRIREGHIM